MFSFRVDGPCIVERARRAVPREISPSQGHCQVGLRSTRSFRVGESDAYRLALQSLGFTAVALTRIDVNPNNIFLSNIDSPSPVVKLGDLGNRRC